ncbi:MAG: hypothetical protein AB2A00_33005 [Myxococcota bacterium]
MSNLLLSDDEIALLRWTCELFFVPESPVHFIDAEAREPRDFAQTYHELLQKGVLDEASFRLTDAALNRLAPLTECDARVLLLLPGDRDRLKARDYYLLDEIAVEYEELDQVHSVGSDLDQGELVTTLARRFMPRRAAGDYLNLKLSPSEFMMMAVLCHRVRKGQGPVAVDALVAELRPALSEGRTDGLAGVKKQAREPLRTPEVRHRAAALLSVAAHEPSPAKDATARSQHPVAASEAEATLVARRQGSHPLSPPEDEVTALDAPPPKKSSTLRKVGDVTDLAEGALKGLLDKGVALRTDRGVELRPAVAAFAQGVSERSRHTFVRFDYGDDEWLVRETSFLAVEGSLFVVAAEDGGGLTVMELDGRRLETWLNRAVGPLPEGKDDNAPGRSAKDFLLRA